MDHLTDSINKKLTDKEFLGQLELLLRLTKKLLSHRKKLIPIQKGTAGFEFNGYRNYSPGDDIKHIDWNVFQRLHELVIKEYTIETPRYWVVALDCSASMFFYQKIALAKHIAAYLIYLFLSLGDKVIFFLYPQNPLNLCYYQGKKNFYPLLYELENIKESLSCQTSFTFQSVFQNLSKNSKAILLSDLYDYEKTREFFSFCQCKKISAISAHIIAPEEKNPPIPQGSKILQDSESKKILKAEISPSFISEYQQRFQNHISQIHLLCNQYGIHYQETNPYYAFPKDILDIVQATGLLRRS